MASSRPSIWSRPGATRMKPYEKHAKSHLGGTILSNHGFRLQLLRLAFELNRLGRLGNALQPAAVGTNGSQVKSIINEKRMTVQYDAPKDNSFRRQTSPFQQMRPRKLSLISEEVHHNVNQRSLKARHREKDRKRLLEKALKGHLLTVGSLQTLQVECRGQCEVELLACLYHRNKKFLDDYATGSHEVSSLQLRSIPRLLRPLLEAVSVETWCYVSVVKRRRWCKTRPGSS